MKKILKSKCNGGNKQKRNTVLPFSIETFDYNLYGEPKGCKF